MGRINCKGDSMFDDLQGKVVVVTGGVTGIGGAASLAFAQAGAKVFAQYLGGGPELAAIEKAGIATLKLDLTEEEAPEPPHARVTGGSTCW
jgi:3-oxoacyl-[acyl-carrier protein] reductase